RRVGLALEVGDLLRHAVFEQTYVFGPERRDEAALLVGRRQKDVRRVRLDAHDRLAVGGRRRLCRGGARPLCGLRRRDNEGKRQKAKGKRLTAKAKGKRQKAKDKSEGGGCSAPLFILNFCLLTFAFCLERHLAPSLAKTFVGDFYLLRRGASGRRRGNADRGA